MAKRMFDMADKDDDGKLSKEETRGPLSANFDKIDANDDGQLEPEEIKKAMEKRREAMRKRFQARTPSRGPGGPPARGPGGPHRPSPEMAKRMFDAADKDDDGKLSKEEAPGHLKMAFDKIDANDDGQLEPEEIKKAMDKFREMMRERMQARGPGRERGGPPASRPDGPPSRRPDGPPSRRPGGPPSRGAGAPHERFKAADKNDDGKLSKEEAGGPLKEHFDKIDADNDGQLTPEEIRKAFEMLRRRRSA
jgi:Ca2+-binding EF-hand superfamily protein